MPAHAGDCLPPAGSGSLHFRCFLQGMSPQNGTKPSRPEEKEFAFFFQTQYAATLYPFSTIG